MSSKEELQKLIKNLETKRFREKESKGLLSAIQEEQTKALQPVLETMAKNLSDRATEMFKEQVAQIKVESPKVEIPEMKFDTESIAQALREAVSGVNITVPEAKINIPAPIVNVPETKIPEYPQFPEDFALRGVDNLNPIPVKLMGEGGKPFSFPVSQGASGGKSDFFTIKGYSQSAFSELTNADGRLRVSVETGGSGLTDAELRFTAVPVSQVSGANWSVSVTDIFASTGADVINPDGRIKVELPTGSSSLTDTELRASAVPVSQVSGANWSVNVAGFTSSVAVVSINPDGTVAPLPVALSEKLDAVNDSITIYAASDFNASVNVVSTVGLTDTQLRASHIDVDQLSGSTWSTSIVSQGVTLDVRQVSGASNSVTILAGSAAIGSVTVNGATNSVIVQGGTLHGVADPGFAPIKIAGVVMTANPTAEVGGDVSNFRTDDIGRQLTRPVQVRDLIVTAYATTTTGAETTLLAASAGSFHDLIMLTATNGSTAAVTVDIRCTTAGNIVHTMVLPASTGPIGFAPSVPWPQDATGNNWTVDVRGSDISGTNVYFTGLFSREV